MADIEDEIRPEPLAQALSERYLAYALSTITQRALPDARDGLKPVHRRLLHAMRELGSSPNTGFKKCARVVGDVIGKFHPHGDQAVYDALVRLAQDFAVRYPLVEGQGNFGNVDGDNPAAMRYTESRLTEVAQALLEGLDEDAVDFRATYDGEDREPVVLPAAFPESARQWLQRHRRRHGDLDPAAQSGRAVRRARSADQESEHAGEARCSNMSRDRISRPAASSSTMPKPSPRPTGPAAGLSACARAGAARRPAAAPITSSSTRSLSGPEGQADRTHRRADRAEEAAAARRYPRRVHRGHPHRAGAEEPHGRAGNPDGAAVPPDRSGNPHAGST